MKIIDIETIPLQYKMDKPIWDAQHYIEARKALLVTVVTDEGIVGYGESASFGGPMISTKTVIDHELKPYFIGQDPFDVEMLWDKVYKGTIQHGRKGIVITALSGIDVALWDIIGKALNKPLYKVLGGFRDKVGAYASSGFYSDGKDIKNLCKEMESYVSSGFRALKMKVGGLNPREDLERVKSVRGTVGEDIVLGVDANSNWDLPTAKWISKRLEDLSIGWIEEPLLPDDVQGSADLAQTTIIPIAGYEQEQTRYGFRNLIENKAVHIIQPDVIWAGGVTETKKIAAIAAAWNLPCMPHGFSSGISLAVNLHFLASTANATLLEFDRNPNPLREQLINEAIKIDGNGTVEVPKGPGLGVEINQDVIEKYRI